MKKSYFLILGCCIVNNTISSSEKNNTKKHNKEYFEKVMITDNSQHQIYSLNCKEKLVKVSPAYIELSKEQRAQDRASFSLTLAITPTLVE